ncbi:hypothetical protein MMC06_004274 [Schaereria dolodes]|nr:hypothetical protein [Schaereria dolodes]
MSLDAGGLAQITYNHNSFSGGLGLPGSGFASRGKGTHIKRLSVAPPAKISTIDENNQIEPTPTPRTSRSHLLAGLRTAPKSATFPTSAPPTQLQQQTGLEGSRYADSENGFATRGFPQTSTGVGFSNTHQNNQSSNINTTTYAHNQQILSPPDIQVGGHESESCMDPNVYADLLRTNQYLAQQQMRLQQQLREVTAAAQQFQGMNMSNVPAQYPQYAQSPVMPNMGGLYNQQLQNDVQPVIQAVPNQPGVYTVYYPMTGQFGYFVDQNVQGQQESRQTISNLELSHSPPPPTPTFRAQVSPPPDSTTMIDPCRNVSPPITSPSPPQDVNPLPPPSANAFRPGHRKALSSATGFSSTSLSLSDAVKTGGLKSAGFPQTPVSGTFGPGQARAGEHPIRQPRGPPSLEELVAKPTAKFEGSKNFATRQRRRAVHNLVRAGLERRTTSRGNGSIDSVESMTPASESEIIFPVSSDNDSDSIGSGSASLSGEPSIGNLRAAANGAIGSERKEMKERSRERNSVDSHFIAASVGNGEGVTVGKKLVEVKMEDSKYETERRKTPLLVLTSAEKRKSSIF